MRRRTGEPHAASECNRVVAGRHHEGGCGVGSDSEDVEELPGLGLCPPRCAIVLLGSCDGIIEIATHCLHFCFAEDAFDVQKPSLGEEVADLVGVVIEPEGPSAWRPRAPGWRDREGPPISDGNL